MPAPRDALILTPCSFAQRFLDDVELASHAVGRALSKTAAAYVRFGRIAGRAWLHAGVAELEEWCEHNDRCTYGPEHVPMPPTLLGADRATLIRCQAIAAEHGLGRAVRAIDARLDLGLFTWAEVLAR